MAIMEAHLDIMNRIISIRDAHPTSFHIIMIIAVLGKIVWDISTVIRTIKPACCMWPISGDRPRFFTRSEIVGVFPDISQTLDKDEVYAFCKDQHIRPLELPCGHIYCKGCTETLMDHENNYCGLCRNSFYAPNTLAPTNLEERKAARAKRILYVHLGGWVLAATCLIIFVGLWAEVSAGFAASAGPDISYQLLCIFSSAYLIQTWSFQTGILAPIKRSKEGWWRAVQESYTYTATSNVWCCLMLKLLCSTLTWVLSDAPSRKSAAAVMQA